MQLWWMGLALYVISQPWNCLCKKAIGVCVCKLTLYPATIPNFLVSPNSLSVESWFSYLENHIIWKQGWLVFLLSNLNPLVPVSCLIALAKPPMNMLSISGENQPPGLVLTQSGNACEFFALKLMLAKGFPCIVLCERCSFCIQFT